MEYIYPQEHSRVTYDTIDRLNQESFLMKEGSELRVLQSLHSVGPSREASLARTVLAGNMSPLSGYGPAHLTIEARALDARHNLQAFLDKNDINPDDVRMLRPERDYTTQLSVVNIDSAELAPDDTGMARPDTAADLMYTFNKELILAARPADCPIVFVDAETPQGRLTALLHLAWLGVAHGYIPQAKGALDELGVDWSTARVQVTAGGHGTTYRYTDFKGYNPHEKFPQSAAMFTDLEEYQDEAGEARYNFGIDVSAEVYQQLRNVWQLDSYQVFHDTSNTTAPESGYSSHSRAYKRYPEDGANTRDLVLGMRQI